MPLTRKRPLIQTEPMGRPALQKKPTPEPDVTHARIPPVLGAEPRRVLLVPETMEDTFPPPPHARD